ncbi:4Fe-4S dicluster domain-containing protein [Halobacteriovorax sp. HLS]|uniref:indolepyruvate ferredoxin oxidoreductase subunit alpha n=1 Tax=Halobacteriovorax sp. HLS TaxID=2234000 RepID=UPI000FDADF05|nr:4Fe-4S dicluster domain-containing protein [Halobacteriovorax sp. HLS]
MNDERTVILENPFHEARQKPLRKGKKPPKLLAVVHQSGCTGCEVCIAGCPVDSIELVPGPVSENPEFRQTVEIDLARCIGCQNCSQDCPWETITMYNSDDAFIAWGSETLKSALYVTEDNLVELNKLHGVEDVVQEEVAE